MDPYMIRTSSILTEALLMTRTYSFKGFSRRTLRRGPHAPYEVKSFIASETPEIDTAEKTETEPEQNPIRCASCGTIVSYREYIIRYAGNSEHVFTNPHGFIFRVGLLQKAPGVFSVGEWTDEFSWFAGFAWRFAVCGGCMTHLGWEYLGTPGGGARGAEGGTEWSRFYGLVVTKLSGWE